MDERRVNRLLATMCRQSERRHRHLEILFHPGSLIKEEMGEYVFLVNGKTKCLINPRKKAKKHVQIIKHLPDQITKLFLEETEISDRMTAKALQEYEIINKTRKNRNQED